MTHRLRVGIFVFDGAEELDWAGPWEVLAARAQGWPDDGVEIYTVAFQISDADTRKLLDSCASDPATTANNPRADKSTPRRVRRGLRASPTSRGRTRHRAKG